MTPRSFSPFVLCAVLLGGCATAPALYDARTLDRPPRIQHGAYSDAQTEMRREGVDGRAAVRITVERDGTVSRAELFEASNPRVAEIAMASARQWRLSPPLKDGKPVRCQEILEIRSPLSPSETPRQTQARFAALGFDGPFEIVPNVDRVPHRVRNPPPVYPRDDLRAGITGQAEVAWVVETDGSVRDARLVTASRPEFGAAAVRWALTQRFSPGLRRGAPVRVAMSQVVRFTINQR